MNKKLVFNIDDWNQWQRLSAAINKFLPFDIVDKHVLAAWTKANIVLWDSIDNKVKSALCAPQENKQ